MAAHHVSLASFVVKPALKNRVETVLVAGSADEELGLISQLMLALLDIAMLQMEMAASVPIPRQEGSVSQDFSARRGHVSQLFAQEVRRLCRCIVWEFDTTNISPIKNRDTTYLCDSDNQKGNG